MNATHLRAQLLPLCGQGDVAAVVRLLERHDSCCGAPWGGADYMLSDALERLVTKPTTQVVDLGSSDAGSDAVVGNAALELAFELLLGKWRVDPNVFLLDGGRLLFACVNESRYECTARRAVRALSAEALNKEFPITTHFVHLRTRVEGPVRLVGCFPLLSLALQLRSIELVRDLLDGGSDPNGLPGSVYPPLVTVSAAHPLRYAYTALLMCYGASICALSQRLPSESWGWEQQLWGVLCTLDCMKLRLMLGFALSDLPARAAGERRFTYERDQRLHDIAVDVDGHLLCTRRCVRKEIGELLFDEHGMETHFTALCEPHPTPLLTASLCAGSTSDLEVCGSLDSEQRWFGCRDIIAASVALTVEDLPL